MILYLGIVFSFFTASVIAQNNDIPEYFFPFEDGGQISPGDLASLNSSFIINTRSFSRIQIFIHGVDLRGDSSSFPLVVYSVGYVDHDIVYRVSNQGNDAETFAQAERAILLATPEFIGHSLLGIVVVTWVLMAPPSCVSPCPDSTFQLLIGKDGSSTYVIYNYGTISSNTPVAFVGYFPLYTDGNVDDLLSNSNYGVQGSYLFEVSNTVLEIGKVICGNTNPCLNGGTCLENSPDECECTSFFEGNFCHLVICDQNPCHNGGTCGGGVCSCQPGFSGIFCEDKLTSVECDSDSMTVTIDRGLIPGGASEVHFLDRYCSGKDSANSNEITLSTGYDECSTTTKETDSTVVFSNVITYEKPEAEGDTAITREYQMQLRVECCLNKSETVDGSFKPHLGKVAFSDKSTGNFDLTMKRFKTASFADEDSSTVWLSKDLFFGVNLNSVESVGMFIDEAWATAGANPDSQPRHDLITGGCPVDDTALVYFSGPHHEGFSVNSFRFVGDHEEVYFHSVVKVCGISNYNEFVSSLEADCESIRSPPSSMSPPSGTERRKRRSADFLSTQTISSGPVRVRSANSDMAFDDVSNYNPFAMLILGIIAAVVAMVILMGVVKLVGRSTNFNYQPVSTETVEGI